jgi:hypothetical protein
MLHAFLILAAEHVEPDKTAFYIGGGALAVWAVLVAALGITQPEFPKTEGAARGVMLISLLLTVATMVTVLATP